MKKYIIFSLVLLHAFCSVVITMCALYQRINTLEQEVIELEHYTKAQIYKKNAQLYLMNTAYGDKYMHKALADSCKNDCLRYKNK